MYLVWYEEDLENNYIVDVRKIYCDIGDERMYATCFILKANEDDDIKDSSNLGIGFFNIYGKHILANDVVKDWSDPVPNFFQFYHLISSDSCKSILQEFGVTLEDSLDLFPLSDEQKAEAKKNFESLDEYFKMKTKARDWFENINRLEMGF